jgi:hypothetical protein
MAFHTIDEAIRKLRQELAHLNHAIRALEDLAESRRHPARPPQFPAKSEGAGPKGPKKRKPA